MWYTIIEHMFLESYRTNLKIGAKAMELLDKLRILSGAAKYDVACTSSGSSRKGVKGGIGNTAPMGICHSFAADGRCISLLKVLLTNECVYDCKYCVNRHSNDVERASFTPEELAELTINFYKRNYIEGLFLSSAVTKNADYTTELMCRTLSILRHNYRFNGYIHAKAIPGASSELIFQLGLLADRISVNIELPSEASLKLLAPQKNKEKIIKPMRQISTGIEQSREEMVLYKNAPRFAPAGQSTQMIVGATDESDYKILTLSESLYKKFNLKRVYYSAYIPVGSHPALPKTAKPPLLREHRLYQADWLLRYYGFSADELLTQDKPNFNTLLDPKCDWALRHIDLFPVDVNTAPYEMLLRVPGIGVTSAKRIWAARKVGKLSFSSLKKIGVVLKRARYFIVIDGKYLDNVKMSEGFIMQNLIGDTSMLPIIESAQQMSLFDYDTLLPTIDPVQESVKCITGQL